MNKITQLDIQKILVTAKKPYPLNKTDTIFVVDIKEAARKIFELINKKTSL
jgi:hypothetical protein